MKVDNTLTMQSPTIVALYHLHSMFQVRISLICKNTNGSFTLFHEKTFLDSPNYNSLSTLATNNASIFSNTTYSKDHSIRSPFKSLEYEWLLLQVVSLKTKTLL